MSPGPVVFAALPGRFVYPSRLLARIDILTVTHFTIPESKPELVKNLQKNLSRHTVLFACRQVGVTYGVLTRRIARMYNPVVDTLV